MGDMSYSQSSPPQEPVDRSSNKGLLFEDLIERLIKAMFPTETWRRTGKSYDGKKDFVFPAEEWLPNQKWAECKNYESNLSLNIIAPTLIMGAIEQVNCILFFSYSPLNDNAIEGLLRYSELGERSIRVYDGALLEYIICTYSTSHGIAEFFPNTDFEAASKKLDGCSLRGRLTLRDLNGEQIPLNYHFAQGERFYIQVIIQNLTLEQINSSLTIESSKDDILQCECDNKTFSLPAAEIQRISILCEALQEGKSELKVKLSTQGANAKIEAIYRKIEVSDEPFLAWSGHNALMARNVALQHLQDGDKAPLLIVGKTGTGKSTLLQILLSEPTVQNHYRILKIDLRQPRNTQTRALLSQALGILCEDQSPKEQIDDDKRTLALLIDNYAGSAEEIATQIMSFYKHTHPFLLVLDNVQDMSGPYTSLIQELDDIANAMGVPIYYLLTLNDSIWGIEEFLSVMNWDTLYQNRVPHPVQLTTFRCADILAFLKTRYGLRNIDKYFERFAIELTPLELHTFCCELRDGHVIERESSGNAYQIVDPFRFSEQIDRLCRAKIPLRHICAALDRNGISETVLKHLYVTGHLSEKLKKHKSIVEKLINQGVLKRVGDNVTFYHEAIREVVRESFVFTEDDCADIIAAPETGEDAKALCILEQLGKLKDGYLFLQTFLETSSDISTPNLRAELCRLIFQHIVQLANANLVPECLRFVCVNFQALNEESGHATLFKFLHMVAETALHFQWDLDEDSVENMAFLIKKFLDRALSSHHEQEIMPYFLKYQAQFSQLKHIKETRRNFWLAHYANRAAIALDRSSDPTLPEPSTVSTLYRASETYSKAADNDINLTLQLAVDELNRHYIYRHDLTIQNTRKTYQQLRKIGVAAQDNPVDEPMVLDYHLRLVKYLQSRLEGSVLPDNFPNLLKETIQSCRSPFYAIKLRIMEIYQLIDLGNFPGAAECLSEAYAYAYRKELRSVIYKLTCIKAQLITLQPTVFSETDNIEQATLALLQMLNIYGQRVNALLRESFLLVSMAKIVTAHDSAALVTIAENQQCETKALLHRLNAYLQGPVVSDEIKKCFAIRSYFSYYGLDFPTI